MSVISDGRTFWAGGASRTSGAGVSTEASYGASAGGVSAVAPGPATVREKIGVEFRRYTILGACNPPLAHKAISADPDIGLLLPCNVVVREEENGNITVAFMDPESVLGLVNRDEITELGGEVRQRLERVRDSLA